MKKTLIISALLISSLSVCGQNWTPNQSVIKANKTVKNDSTKVFQCWGTTQKGERCKHKVSVNGAFCWQHANQVITNTTVKK